MSKNIADEIKDITDINLFDCYQCGKCSAGCIFVYLMDTPPHQLIRFIQLNLRDRVLASNTFWGCGACVTCSVRCPREIDVLRVINTVRDIAISEKIKPKNKDIYLFDKIFLDNIIKNDRLNEFLVGAYFNLRSGKIFKDISLLPTLLKKDKLSCKEKVKTRNIAKIIKKLASREN